MDKEQTRRYESGKPIRLAISLPSVRRPVVFLSSSSKIERFIAQIRPMQLIVPLLNQWRPRDKGRESGSKDSEQRLATDSNGRLVEAEVTTNFSCPSESLIGMMDERRRVTGRAEGVDTNNHHYRCSSREIGC